MIIVTDGGGPFGRLVVDRLLRRVPPRRVAVTARDPATVADLAERGVDVRRHAFDDEASAAAALAHADRVLSNPPVGWNRHTGGEGQTLDQAVACARAAISARVPHIVHMGLINNDGTDLLGHNALEAGIRGGGVPYTILRANLMSEALIPAARLASASGEYLCSFRDQHIAPASGVDYAEVAATVLADGGHLNVIHSLSGRLAFTPLGIASAISLAVGRDIPLRETTPWDLIRGLRAAGATGTTAATLSDLYSFAASGEFARQTETLDRLLERPSTSLVETLRAAVGPGAAAAPDQDARQGARGQRPVG